jgi:hypothetical protein
MASIHSTRFTRSTTTSDRGGEEGQNLTRYGEGLGRSWGTFKHARNVKDLVAHTGEENHELHHREPEHLRVRRIGHYMFEAVSAFAVPSTSHEGEWAADAHGLW